MRVSLLCSDPNHPIYSMLSAWASSCDYARVEIIEHSTQATEGDFLFLISCTEIIKADIRSRYSHSLVLHASALPEGRGWSPHIWSILEGKSEFTVSLLEAEDGVDSGKIWLQRKVFLEGHELYDEINTLLFSAELQLIEEAVRNVDLIVPHMQASCEPAYYRRRIPDDSRVDPHRSLADQFDLLRVSDSNRYPPFFNYRGHRYEIILKKVK